MSQQQDKSANDNGFEGEEKRRRGRRTRKDCDERSFVCKLCMKSYLSNAALYTHMKTKHEGSEKVQKPPKSEKDKQNYIQYKNQTESPLPPPQPLQPANESSKEAKQFRYQSLDQQNVALQNLRNYLKKYFPERNRGCSIKLICEDLAPQIYQYIEPILREACQKKYTQAGKPNLTISEVFGIFLMLMNSRVSSACINFLLRVFFYFNLSLKVQSKRSDICQIQNAMNLPNYFNSTILNKRIPAHGFDEDEMMHNPLIICNVFEYFGDWLYDERFTDFKITANYEKNV